MPDLPLYDNAVAGTLFIRNVVDGHGMPFGELASKGTGVIRVLGIPIQMTGDAGVSCGEVSARFCYQGICIDAGAEIPCSGSGVASGAVSNTIDIRGTISMASFYPCTSEVIDFQLQPFPD